MLQGAFPLESACNVTEKTSIRIWDLMEMLTFSQKWEIKKVRLPLVMMKPSPRICLFPKVLKFVHFFADSLLFFSSTGFGTQWAGRTWTWGWTFQWHRRILGSRRGCFLPGYQVSCFPKHPQFCTWKRRTKPPLFWTRNIYVYWFFRLRFFNTFDLPGDIAVLACRSSINRCLWGFLTHLACASYYAKKKNKIGFAAMDLLKII